MMMGRVKGALQVAKLHGPSGLARRTVAEVTSRHNGARGLPDQRDLVDDLLRGDDPAWLVWLDGGRYDHFERAYPDYFEGDLTRVWNGDTTWTGEWIVRNLAGDYPGNGLFTSTPLRGMDVGYDGRDHFDIVPEPDLPDTSTVEERLATLGYLSMEHNRLVEIAPGPVNECVRDHLDAVTGGVVRYLKPHPPFDGLEQITSGAGKIRRTRSTLLDGDLTWGELEAAYVRTYRDGLEAAADIIPDLPGRVVITADHGECLRCGQLFHAGRHGPHRHLVDVPWFEVER